jgi:hypothetical protein
MVGGVDDWEAKAQRAAEVMLVERKLPPLPDDYRNAWSIKRQMTYGKMGYSIERVSQLMRNPNEVTWGKS